MLEIQTMKQDSLRGKDCVISDAALSILSDTKDLSSLAESYTSYLKKAAEEDVETLYFPCVSSQYSQPVLYRAISLIYRTILEFGESEETSVKKVCIVCDSDALQNTYMVVWNFYFAGTKSARMNDGRWD